MAQETKPSPDKRESKFHYYSGGEIKEQSGVGVSPALWILFTVLIIAAPVIGILSGALGPKVHAFRAPDSSKAKLNAIQQQLNGREGTGLRYASVNLNELPIPQGETIDGAVVKGSEVYQTYCIGCHGPNQDGNGPNASSLNPKPRNLRDAPFMQGMSYQRITTSLHKGVPGTAMPRWENTLSEAEIGNAIAYVFSLTSPTAPAAVTTSTASGGSKQYVNGIQNSPKPITPAIGGNPAAHTNTAPPSLSGPSPDEVKARLAVPNNAATPDNTGPAAPPIILPKPGAPVPGSTTPNGMSGAGTAPSSATGM